MQKNSELSRRIAQALMIVGRYGRVEGAHHKQWVLDQIVRALTGTSTAYKEWVADYPNWDKGIQP